MKTVKLSTNLVIANVYIVGSIIFASIPRERTVWTLALNAVLVALGLFFLLVSTAEVWGRDRRDAGTSEEGQQLREVP